MQIQLQLQIHPKPSNRSKTIQIPVFQIHSSNYYKLYCCNNKRYPNPNTTPTPNPSKTIKSIQSLFFRCTLQILKINTVATTNGIQVQIQLQLQIHPKPSNRSNPCFSDALYKF